MIRSSVIVHEGVAALERESAKNSTKSPPGELLATVADVLFSDSVLETLRAIFDDNRVAIRADVIDDNEDAFA